MLLIRNCKILDRKYYFANTRYHNTDYLLYLYHSIWYYLKKQLAIRKKPVNKEELFNFCHLSLCNMIERIFKVIKRYNKTVFSNFEISIKVSLQYSNQFCLCYYYVI